ncbi:tetratricopeptide repeat protein [Candidatus Margulisiibacteriota bacterium]
MHEIFIDFLLLRFFLHPITIAGFIILLLALTLSYLYNKKFDLFRNKVSLLLKKRILYTFIVLGILAVIAGFYAAYADYAQVARLNNMYAEYKQISIAAGQTVLNKHEWKDKYENLIRALDATSRIHLYEEDEEALAQDIALEKLLLEESLEALDWETDDKAPDTDSGIMPEESEESSILAGLEPIERESLYMEIGDMIIRGSIEKAEKTLKQFIVLDETQIAKFRGVLVQKETGEKVLPETDKVIKSEKSKESIRDKIISMKKTLAERQRIMAELKELRSDNEGAKEYQEKAKKLEGQAKAKATTMRGIINEYNVNKKKREEAAQENLLTSLKGTGKPVKKTRTRDRMVFMKVLSNLLLNLTKKFSAILFFVVAFIVLMIIIGLGAYFLKDKYNIPDITFEYYSNLADESGKMIHGRDDWKRKFLETKEFFEKHITDCDLFTGAVKELEKGDLETTEALLEQSIGRDEEFCAEKHYLLGSIRELRIDYKGAEQSLKKSVELEPENTRYLNSLGWFYDAFGKPEESIQYFEKALSIDISNNGEMNMAVDSDYNNLGGALLDLGKYKRALYFFEKAQDISIEMLGYDHPYTKSVKSNIQECKRHLAREEKKNQKEEEETKQHKENGEPPQPPQDQQS